MCRWTVRCPRVGVKGFSSTRPRTSPAHGRRIAAVSPLKVREVVISAKALVRHRIRRVKRVDPEQAEYFTLFDQQAGKPLTCHHRARHEHPRRCPRELRSLRPGRQAALTPHPRPRQDHPLPHGPRAEAEERFPTASRLLAKRTNLVLVGGPATSPTRATAARSPAVTPPPKASRRGALLTGDHQGAAGQPAMCCAEATATWAVTIRGRRREGHGCIQASLWRAATPRTGTFPRWCGCEHSHSA